MRSVDAGCSRRRRCGGVGAALGVLLLGGCNGLTAAPRSPFPNQAQSLETFAAAYAPDEIIACLRRPVADQRPCRDSISYALMAAIDVRYAEFEEQFFDQSRYGGFAATLATLGLTAAGSVAGSAATANILSAIATGVTGAREGFTREILAERTAAALTTAMQAARAELSLQIRAGLREAPERYPLGWALNDIHSYYRAGTIPGALATVTRAVGAEGARARNDLAVQSLTRQTAVRSGSGEVTSVIGAAAAPVQRPLPPVPPQATDEENRARACLQQLLRDPDRVVAARNRAEMISAMARLVPPVTDASPLDFVLQQRFRPHRVEVARTLCPAGAAPVSPAVPAPASVTVPPTQ